MNKCACGKELTPVEICENCLEVVGVGEVAGLRQRIAELKSQLSDERLDRAGLRAACIENQKLRQRAAVLESQISESAEAYKRTIMEQCGDDEHHCACVPHLRRRIAELEAEMSLEMTALEMHRDTLLENERLEAELSDERTDRAGLRAACIENQRLRQRIAELERVVEFHRHRAQALDVDVDNITAEVIESDSEACFYQSRADRLAVVADALAAELDWVFTHWQKEELAAGKAKGELLALQFAEMDEVSTLKAENKRLNEECDMYAGQCRDCER